ncbi:hypothetical protein [Anianabacter salinae]|uniref:hypothetical protein n=1 Tax=Anianabacter salinae TaxID=2851023 RepID=UPI00225DF4BE|nr:hypothetical protein [Anianabacter salinae]
MARQDTDTPTRFAIYSREKPPADFERVERMSLIVSILWIIAVGAALLFVGGRAGSDAGFRFVLTILIVFMPVAMLWVGVMAARSSLAIREESRRLEVAIDALRALVIDSQRAAQGAAKSSVEKKLEEIAQSQRQTESAIATFTSIRSPGTTDEDSTKPAIPKTETTPEGEQQGLLALTDPIEPSGPPVNVSDFILALNFPENADDKEGFQALRRALRDRSTAQLVQAAQDLLTLLSQEGIYMDDLSPDRARPEVWRRFARGERGRAVAALGGVRDRSCLALTAGRMRGDLVFRDSAHHFLRKFDAVFSEFEKTASDEDISRLAGTRTARAFMLMGRVTGTFD